MKENISTEGVEFIQRKNRYDFIGNSGIKKAPGIYFVTCVMALLFLMSMEVSLPLRAAGQQNPRQALIAADVAAGKDIALIIQEAVAGGMSVANAVEAIVDAGVDPGRVVYIAITANYSAESVVQGAITAVLKMGLSEADFQNALTLISSAALQAGANDNQIITGAANAGVANNIIANAIARAKQNPAPVFGYSAPAEAGATTTRWHIGGSDFSKRSRQGSPYTP
ncbi:MAG: hypothetical protein R6V76_12035 [Desulfobacterales bacterium]